jgi:hypothetical protein
MTSRLGCRLPVKARDTMLGPLQSGFDWSPLSTQSGPSATRRMGLLDTVLAYQTSATRCRVGLGGGSPFALRDIVEAHRRADFRGPFGSVIGIQPSGPQLDANPRVSHWGAGLRPNGAEDQGQPGRRRDHWRASVTTLRAKRAWPYPRALRHQACLQNARSGGKSAASSYGSGADSMANIHYRIVAHDGGWAYKLNDVFSEPFPSKAAAFLAGFSTRVMLGRALA